MGWGIAAAAAGQAIGGFLQNRAQRREAATARKFNAAEALKNRQFQERMSNTAWRRGMADMRAAGINPMLAIDKGGASTPGGAGASGPMAQMVNELGPATSGAMDAVRLKQDLRQSNAQIGLTNMQAEVARTTALRNQAATALDVARLTEAELRSDAARGIRQGFEQAKEGWRQIPGALFDGIAELGSTIGAIGTAREAERRVQEHSRQPGPIAIPRIGARFGPGDKNPDFTHLPFNHPINRAWRAQRRRARMRSR